MQWKKLRTLILTWSFVPTMVALATVALVTFMAYEDAEEERTIERYRELVSLSAARLQEELTKFTDVLEALARTEGIYRDNPVGRRVALRDARRRLAVFDGGVVLLDNFGRVVAAEPERPEILGQDWSDRDYFRDMLGSQGLVLSDAVTDGPNRAEVVVIAVPVTGTGGEFLGTLAGMFRTGSPAVSAFYASIVRLRIGEGGSTYLVDGNGRIIYHSNPGRLGEILTAQEPFARVLKGESGVIRLTDQNGQAIVTGFAPVPGTSWGLVTEEEWASLASSGERYGRFLLILLALGMVLPAIGVGLFVRQRQAEALERQSIEQELHVARLIQETLLPRELPALPGWQVAVHWQPARAVGGDFYDFLVLPDGRLYLAIGDVSGKGVPAALVMASTRAVLRGSARRLLSPGAALERSNELLSPEIPSSMFVTCLYGILDPSSGRFQFANAGQNLPCLWSEDKVEELWVTGFPLGIMPGVQYEEKEITLSPGESLLLYSDGLVEAHNARQEMFGIPRLRALLEKDSLAGSTLIDGLLAELDRFAGPNWDQEDDVTLVTLQRMGSSSALAVIPDSQLKAKDGENWRTLSEFSIPSQVGEERLASERVIEAVTELNLPHRCLERLETAVAEATMNAMEHGNHYQAEVPVSIRVLVTDTSTALAVHITDQGGAQPFFKPEIPDLEAKLAGRQPPRGWGLFLNERMVDEIHVASDQTHHTVELIMYLNGA